MSSLIGIAESATVGYYQLLQFNEIQYPFFLDLMDIDKRASEDEIKLLPANNFKQHPNTRTHDFQLNFCPIYYRVIIQDAASILLDLLDLPCIISIGNITG